MRLWALGAVLLISGVAGAAGPQAAVPPASDEDVKITGCVVKGDGGFVLLPLDEAGGWASALPPAGTSARSGMSEDPPGMMRVLYWLDEDDLEDHAGQRVEITGELEDDFDAGEVSVKRDDDGLLDVEFKRGDDRIAVKLPHPRGAVGTSGGISDDEKEFEYVVRKVDVKDVKMLASVCQ